MPKKIQWLTKRSQQLLKSKRWADYQQRVKAQRARRLRLMKSPMPTKFTTKMRYVEQYSINPGASGLCASYVFSANGLYDPNITSTGHQPRGFDQLIQIYDHYVVTGSKITIRTCAPSTETSNYIIGVALRDGPTTDTDPNDYLEGSYNKWRIVPSGSNGVTKIVQKASVGKFLGRNNVLSDSQLKGSASGNPTEQCYFHVWASSLELTDPGAIYFVAEVEFILTFIEPKDVAQS